MKRHSDLRRLSRNNITDTNLSSNDAQVSTLSKQDMESKQEQKPQSLKISENDFDLYILLKEMVGSKQKSVDLSNSDQSKPRPKNQFKDYKKLLTATLLPTHFVDGSESWSIVDNGFDMYRSRIRCIGTRLADCGLGEPVFLDLQPLSTRIELMCKLIIIIQGACLERAGPPKLVQDRCVQFDGCDKDVALPNDTKISRIKSISCETLISENGFNDITFNDTEIKISISSSSVNGQFSSPDTRHRSRLAFSDDESLKETDCAYSFTNNIDLRLNKARDTQLFDNNYDMEHYFKYRLSKASLLKDYASATYYQYGGSDQKGNKAESKQVNTDESFLATIAKVVTNKEKKFVDKATSTHGADFGFELDKFSKRQILSPNTLHKEKATQIDATADTCDSGFKTYKLQTNSLLDYIIAPKQDEETGKRFVSRHEIPISLSNDTDRHLFANKETYTYTHKQEYLIKLNKTGQNQGDTSKEILLGSSLSSPAAQLSSSATPTQSCEERRDIKVVSTVKAVMPKLRSKDPNDRHRSWVFKFTNCLESSGNDDEDRRLAAIKAGPKKSHEWSLFNSNKSSRVTSGDESEAEVSNKNFKND